MGGINCDKSDGRTAQVEHIDSRDYAMAVVTYSKTLFRTLGSFAELQERVEDLCIAEEATPSASPAMFQLIRGSAANLRSSSEALEAAAGALVSAAEKNLADEDLLGFARESYSASDQAGLPAQGRSAGFLPSCETLEEHLVGLLVSGADPALARDLRERASKLTALVRGVLTEIEPLQPDGTTPNFYLAIRELQSKFAPLSMRMLTSLTELLVAQGTWAFLNMVSFPSVSGVETDIETMNQ